MKYDHPFQYVPLIKAIQLSLIKLSTMGVILSARSLGKILKSIFRRQMDVYCMIVLASLVFGTSVMTPSLNLLKVQFVPVQIMNHFHDPPFMSVHNFLKVTMNPFGLGANSVLVPTIASAISFSEKGVFSKFSQLLQVFLPWSKTLVPDAPPCA
jgi:hypothetical protein